MASKSYNLRILKDFPKEKLKKVKEILASYPHPRLVRHLTRKAMFMDKASWHKALKEASIEKLASLIRLASILSQTKVYLFWQRRPGS